MRAADHRTIRARAVHATVRDEGGAILERWRDFTINGGRPCCGKTTRVGKPHPKWRACVCAHLENCPDHGLTHVGTHD